MAREVSDFLHKLRVQDYKQRLSKVDRKTLHQCRLLDPDMQLSQPSILSLALIITGAHLHTLPQPWSRGQLAGEHGGASPGQSSLRRGLCEASATCSAPTANSRRSRT